MDIRYEKKDTKKTKLENKQKIAKSKIYDEE